MAAAAAAAAVAAGVHDHALGLAIGHPPAHQAQVRYGAKAGEKPREGGMVSGNWGCAGRGMEEHRACGRHACVQAHTDMTWAERTRSSSESGVSSRMKIRSKRERMAFESLRFSETVLFLLTTLRRVSKGEEQVHGGGGEGADRESSLASARHALVMPTNRIGRGQDACA